METVVVWLLSVQLWTDDPPKIKFVYNKEYATYEECMENREIWAQKNFQSFCLTKVKTQ
jgi:hypothetical protein